MVAGRQRQRGGMTVPFQVCTPLFPCSCSISPAILLLLLMRSASYVYICMYGRLHMPSSRAALPAHQRLGLGAKSMPTDGYNVNRYEVDYFILSKIGLYVPPCHQLGNSVNKSWPQLPNGRRIITASKVSFTRTFPRRENVFLIISIYIVYVISPKRHPIISI